MPFTTIDFMTPIADLIKAYPEPVVAFQNIDVVDFVNLDNVPPGMGNLLNSAGQPPIAITEDVIGRAVATERLNLIFLIRRNADFSETNRGIQNFLINIIRWINHTDAQRGTPEADAILPHFSQTKTERISASGGIWMGRGEFGDEFQIQIHLDYETILREEI